MISWCLAEAAFSWLPSAIQSWAILHGTYTNERGCWSWGTSVGNGICPRMKEPCSKVHRQCSICDALCHALLLAEHIGKSDSRRDCYLHDGPAACTMILLCEHATEAPC